MFTGIVQAVGHIIAIKPRGDGMRLDVDVGAHSYSEIKIGDSVAVAGCCLTVVAIEGSRLSFDVSAETLRCTSGLDRAADVNLETALRLSDPLGGHLMSGHVDGVSNAEGSRTLVIEAPSALARFIAAKGSIAVDGVSLTVNRVERACFEANLIPHTLAVTTLGRLKAGARVNLEVDLVARYVARLAAFER